MGIVDVLIILLVLFGGVVGFKRGFTKEIVSFLGLILIFVIAFYLKNPVSVFLYENLPFFKFGGIIKGVTVLNIALYEIIAFLIVLTVLTVALKLLLFATGIFETFLNFTIVLGIPSKILGALVGMVEYFIITFIILYILSLPVFKIDIIHESKYRNKILNSTPVLSKMASKTLDIFNEFGELKDKYETMTNPMEFNRETLKLFLDYKIITVKSVDKLVEKNKIEIDNIEGLLKNYREG